MSPMGIGFPDGNPNKSIVVDYKQVLTITPNNGRIKFALVSSPYGCIALARGQISNNLNLPRFANTTSLAYAWEAWTPTTFNQANSYFITPFQENASYPVDGEAMGPYAAGQYRGLVVAADVVFTGSTMANGGVVSVYKASPNIVDLPSSVYNTVTVLNKDVTDLDAGSTNVTVSGRYTGPARVPLSLRSASAKPEYRATWENTQSTEIIPMFLGSTGTIISGAISPGFDNSIPITIVDYSGLDASASVTIEVRSCMELVPKVGTMAAFAKPSPPASLATWEKVANYVRSLPAATILRTAAAGASGYATGGIAGSLAGMASSF